MRLPFVLVGNEEVHPVEHERSTQRAARLLVLVRKHAVQDSILRVHGVMPEVPAAAPREGVGARLGDRVDDHPGRPALRRVEPVRHHLELLDGVAAEARLLVVAAGVVVARDLLSIDVGLAIPLAVLDVATRFVAAGTRRQQCQVHPVAAVDRQFGHLLGVDVGPDRGRRRVDQRRLAGHRHRLLQRSGSQRQRGVERCREEHIHISQRHRLKARQRRSDLVDPRPNRHAEAARRAGHGFKDITRCRMDGDDGYTW